MKIEFTLRCAAIGFAALLLTCLSFAAPSPTPPPCPSTPPPPGPCPTFGWAEGLATLIAPNAAFPTQDTRCPSSTDCNFHQWSWEAFIWATAFESTPGLPPLPPLPRFLTLPNLDGVDNPALAVKGPKTLALKPRTIKPRGSQQADKDFEQAGPRGILVDQNGQAVWYSTHANEAYFDVVKKYYGRANYAKASPTFQFPVGAAVFKASWQIVPAGAPPPTGFFTTTATVPILKNNPNGGIMIDQTAQPRSVTVALVGLHVVGVTANHFEFLWGTFEQVNNAPDLKNPTGPVSPDNFTFYKAGTDAADCNPFPSPSKITVTDPAAQKLAPTTNVYREFKYGGEDSTGAKEIDGVNEQGQNAVASFPNQAEAIWKNYKLIGTVWTKPNSLVPGDGHMDTQAIGSVNLANATLETFVQGSGTNCFSCHNTSANAQFKIPAKNINLSHKLLDPFFHASPSPSPSPAPTAKSPAAKPKPGGQ